MLFVKNEERAVQLECYL